MDGVAFNYLNVGGERKINFFSGKVEALGISAIASRVGEKKTEDVEASLIYNNVAQDLEREIGLQRREIQKLVANVIMTAKRKDPRDWQREAFQYTLRSGKSLAKLHPSKMYPLQIFLGGAGAGSEWYRCAILSAYDDFNHHNAGIPPYDLIEVPKPSDLTMNGLHRDCFRRLAIAYGLSVPFGEGPKHRFAKPIPTCQTPETAATNRGCRL